MLVICLFYFLFLFCGEPFNKINEQKSEQKRNENSACQTPTADQLTAGLLVCWTALLTIYRELINTCKFSAMCLRANDPQWLDQLARKSLQNSQSPETISANWSLLV